MEPPTPWHEPSEYRSRPVAVIGAGVLGRRIASCWAAAGYNVHIYDPDSNQRHAAVRYFTENKATYQKATRTSVAPAQIHEHDDIRGAVQNAWHIVECVPENLAAKHAVFADLEQLSDRDCILATNSSSFRSSLISANLLSQAKCRVLNTHYFMPPHVRAVELMTNGHTAADIFTFLAKRMDEAGLNVYVAKKESTGFIHNRVWAAMKRELLRVVAEGVADPKTVDDIFFETVVVPGLRPFVAMDLVGLDTVALIERNFAAERRLDMSLTVDFLQREYIDHGKLGLKSEKGGFYPPPAIEDQKTAGPRLFVLDNGLSGPVDTLEKGEVLEYTAAGQHVRTIFTNQYLPDGIVVSKDKTRIFWTCMGFPGADDGTIHSANLDGSDKRQLTEKGALNTPKQITIDASTGTLYIADREGLGIWRCDPDGHNLEQLIATGTRDDKGQRENPTLWCVGVAVSHRLARVFWTQKGGPKAWQGRVFSAGIDVPAGESPAARSDIVCLAQGLAEPVDLDFDDESQMLYWTDRGEMPFGNTLNRLRVGADGGRVEGGVCTPHLTHEVVARKFHEAIGLKIDVDRGHIYVADLGGSICRCDLDGRNKTRLLFEEGRAFTGIALV